MTTIYTYKYYDVYTLPHKGKFPHTTWESDPVALYGCPKVTTHILIYPNGNCSTQGLVSAYITFNSTDPLITLEATMSIKINNKALSAQQPFSVGNDPSCSIKFGHGWGYQTGWEMCEIFKEPNTTLQYSVKVTIDLIFDIILYIFAQNVFCCLFSELLFP